MAESHLQSLCIVQGEAGTGNVVEAVRHCRAVMGAVKSLQAMDDDELYVYAKEIRAPIELVRQVSLSESWQTQYPQYFQKSHLAALHCTDCMSPSSQRSINRQVPSCGHCVENVHNRWRVLRPSALRYMDVL